MDLCFVDTETTGLHPSNHEIWEFAGIRRAEDGTEKRLWLQIEPGNLGNADPFAIKLGKYHERFGANGFWAPDPITDGAGNIVSMPTPERGEVFVSKYEAAAVIEEFTRDTMLWGNCVHFDENRLDRLLRDHGQLPGWHYHIQDVEGHIIGYLRALQKYEGADVADALEPPYNSSTLSAAIGVPEPDEDERHTAMGDALWVMRQYDALYGDDVQVERTSEPGPDTSA